MPVIHIIPSFNAAHVLVHVGNSRSRDEPASERCLVCAACFASFWPLLYTSHAMDFVPVSPRSCIWHERCKILSPCHAVLHYLGPTPLVLNFAYTRPSKSKKKGLVGMAA